MPGVHQMKRYSAFAVAREALRFHTGWERAWRSPEPRRRYDVVIVGAGGHGLATAYYLGKNFGITNVAVIEKGWLGGGNTGRNTTIIRSNYLQDPSAAIYEKARGLYETLSQDLNYNVMFSPRGVMMLAQTQHEIRGYQRTAHANALQGVETRFITPAEVKVEETDGQRRAVLMATGEELVIGPIEKMSKSKKNVVDPDDIIASYGADTARWFMLSDSPPDRDVIWTEAGVEGAHRFVQRVWRLVSEAAPLLKDVIPAAGTEADALEVSRAAHRTVKAVSEEIERLGFNKAVARIYELVNALSPQLARAGEPGAATKGALRQAVEMLVLMISPMMPHLAEECWAAIGGRGMAAEQGWPAYDPSLVVDDEIVLPVQINGKKRGDLTIARDADQAAIESAVLELDVVRKALEGRSPRKVIVVPQRIVNVVV